MLLAAGTASQFARAEQVPAPKSAADVPGTPPGTIMRKDYVVMIARTAYLWGWPLVNQINRRASFAKAPEPGRLGGVLPVAPTGRICMLTDYIAADQHFSPARTRTRSMGPASWGWTSSQSLFKCRISAVAFIPTSWSITERTASIRLVSNTTPDHVLSSRRTKLERHSASGDHRRR